MVAMTRPHTLSSRPGCHGWDFTFVMPGLVPGIHVFLGYSKKTWMAGTSPAMTT
jgi:hypothetical protein